MVLRFHVEYRLVEVGRRGPYKSFHKRHVLERSWETIEEGMCSALPCFPDCLASRKITLIQSDDDEDGKRREFYKEDVQRMKGTRGQEPGCRFKDQESHDVKRGLI